MTVPCSPLSGDPCSKLD
ncbi:hypothetical protein F383_32294 [Gossypium arboreum]|uniref:Uncharacterized protein n=1 Tax=Gossypium arboreum TaxID=29729 RepID=A0A0B0PNL7_GOSAR|nr:hypothetical protein F383_32294 [Gossypium arboreum]